MIKSATQRTTAFLSEESQRDLKMIKSMEESGKRARLNQIITRIKNEIN
jgi:hypothetical protein